MNGVTPHSLPDLSHPNGNGIHVKTGGPKTLSGDITERPEPPVFTDKLKEREYVKFRLAQALRMFAELNYDERVAGHITARDPIKPDCFWVNPFGVHFSLIQPSTLILVSHDGNIVLPESASAPVKRLNPAAFMIHSAIHAARPDVMCAAHSHSMYGKAFSAFGAGLDMITQDSCAFYNDLAIYDQFGGVVLNKEEGERIAQRIGNKKAIILQNHGILVACPSIESTLAYYITLERCCQVQLLVDAAAASGRPDRKPKIIPDEEAAEVWKTVGVPVKGYFSGLCLLSDLENREGVTFQF